MVTHVRLPLLTAGEDRRPPLTSRHAGGNNAPPLREAVGQAARVLRMIRGYWGPIAKGLVLSLVVGLVGMVSPYVSKLLIDRAYPARDVPLMHFLVGGVLAITIASAAMGAFRSYYSQAVSLQLSAATRLMFLNHLQHLPVRFFEEHRVGEVMSRFGDLSGSVSAVTGAFQTVMLRGVYLLLVPPMLFLLNWKLALLSIATLPVTTLIGTTTGRLMRRYWREGAEASANLSAHQMEVMSHIRTFKTMAAEHRVYRTSETQVTNLVTLQLKSGLVGTLVGVANGAIRAVGLAVFTWFAWTLILKGELSLGDFVAFTAYQGYLVGPLGQFAGLFTSVQQTAVTLGRTFEYLDHPAEQDPTLAYEPAPPIHHRLSGDIRFEGVSFAYRPDALVLRDVELEIRAGSVVAVVGRSGAGKSTLFRLICRLDEPTSGAIRADGVSLQQISLPDLRRQVSIVLQDVGLIRGTLWDNLTLGTEQATPADVALVIRACRLDEFVAELPKGLETPVAEWGASLSGGQRQRVAIARALLRDTPILLLDEATSSLDVETEAMVVRELFSRVPRRTLVFATHRIATAALADQIVVLDGGRLVSTGSHADLLETCSTYRSLYQVGPGEVSPLTIAAES